MEKMENLEGFLLAQGTLANLLHRNILEITIKITKEEFDKLKSRDHPCSGLINPTDDENKLSGIGYIFIKE